ncbi:MerR family transcriptional regulator [Calidifontibacillus erzurumensis]|uniref:MerR family transcriptional regulator n=1 Tax=Calidifontibacillus erzurumensis TaxID=2741433 RepID=A0A8J8GFZ1_9BACI|nr:MerR family transcriptional regulator [Calidifontibacillus erzurumensis]NSL53194.1 MerR family transcriptional regulator [Calidifontibacillus erzurumensis]
MDRELSYKDKKVITIGTVCELTGLTERQIRYYEEKKLVFPERSKGKIRKYSFSDIETLIKIASMVEEGVQTFEIRQKMKKQKEKEIERKLIQGQINAHFGLRNGKR